MAILTTRRSLLWGLFAAPAVVTAANLMPVKLWVPEPAKIIAPEPLVGRRLGVSVRRCGLAGHDEWVPVGLVDTIGHFGSERVEFETISDGRVRKAKGLRDTGELSIGCFHDPSDAGQSLLSDAERDITTREFRIEPPDGSGDHYFQGFVMSERVRVPYGDDSVVRRDFNIALNSAVVIDGS